MCVCAGLELLVDVHVLTTGVQFPGQHFGAAACGGVLLVRFWNSLCGPILWHSGSKMKKLKLELSSDLAIQTDVRENMEKQRQLKVAAEFWESAANRFEISEAAALSIRVGDYDQVADHVIRKRCNDAAVQTLLVVAESEGFVPSGSLSKMVKKLGFFDECDSNEAGFGWNRG